MTMAEAMSRGRELGIGITITEHLDLDYPLPEAFIFDIDAYFREYMPYRSETVLLGVEMGMRPECIEENRRIANNYPFDYIIGSVHIVDAIDIYSAEFYRQRGKKEVYDQYFDAMVNCVESYDFIHALGHIDYIARYARYPDTEVYYDEFQERIDAVLKPLAERGKAIEINTRRLDSKDCIKTLVKLYRRFAELGGIYATVGSDAHKPQDIGRRLSVAMDIARESGLTVVRYKEGKPFAY